MTVAKTGVPASIGTNTEVVTFTQVHPGAGVALSSEQLAVASRRVFAVEIDNTSNADPSWLKLWVSSPTIGTTVPTMILKADGNTKVQYTVDRGVVLSLIYAAVLTTKGTAGTTAPAGTVTTRMLLGT
jgi:hypothetical protein|tara:strand:- start:86 stop:469 length:384 start_codon:yes stop_codon:yes gene_type:complete